MKKKVLKETIPAIAEVINGLLQEKGLKYTLGNFSLIAHADILPHEQICPGKKPCIDPVTGNIICREYHEPCN